MADWFSESLYPTLGQRFRAQKELFRLSTGLQELVIFENAMMGRIMALDGVIQTTEGDEFIYHEMLTHVPILAHGAVQEVLIIGGGDGGMLRRSLEHRSIRRVTMVEIDQGVVDMSRTWMPNISAGAFDSPRLDLVIADGRDYIANCDREFQVIIVDSTDPAGPGEVLFTQDFYAACKARLAPGGILCTQNGVPFFQPDELRNTHQRFKALFADASFFVGAVPTYYGGHMAFGWGTDNPALRRQGVDLIRARYLAAGLQTRYYTPEIHVASFALPRFMEQTLGL